MSGAALYKQFARDAKAHKRAVHVSHQKQEIIKPQEVATPSDRMPMPLQSPRVTGRDQSWSSGTPLGELAERLSSAKPSGPPRGSGASRLRAVEKWMSVSATKERASAGHKPSDPFSTWFDEHTSTKTSKHPPTDAAQLSDDWLIESAPVRALMVKLGEYEKLINELRDDCGNVEMYKTEAGKVGPLKGQVKALQQKLSQFQAGEHPPTSGVPSPAAAAPLPVSPPAPAAAAQQPLLLKIGELSKKLFESEQKRKQLQALTEQQQAELSSLKVEIPSVEVEVKLPSCEVEVEVEVKLPSIEVEVKLPSVSFGM